MALETTINIVPACTSAPHKVVRGGSLCFDLSGNVSQAEEGERYPDAGILVSVNMTQCDFAGYFCYCKTGGAQNTFDAFISEPTLIHPRQNCYIQQTSSIVPPPSGRSVGWMRLQNPNDATDRYQIQMAQINTHLVAYIFVPGSTSHVAIYDPGANGIGLQEGVRIWMNGSQVLFQHNRAGNWITFYSAALGANYYKAEFGSASLDHPLIFPRIFKGSWSYPIDCQQIVVTTPDGGIVTGDGCRKCFAVPNADGIYRVQFDYPDSEQIECEIEAQPLQIFNLLCNQPDAFVLVGSLVTIEHNGGETAELIVSGGAALDAYTWLTPTLPGEYSIFVRAFGNDSAPCVVQIENPLIVAGVVEGVYDNVAPGECIEFQTNCPPEEVTFQCVEFPDAIQNNKFCANYGREECFGAMTATIIARGCSQTVEFEVRVMPVFPVPLFCGPKPQFFPTASRKRTTTKSVTRGGAAEFSLHGVVPVVRWKGLNYVGLPMNAPRPDDCPEGLQIPCVDNPDRPTQAGCPAHLRTAQRLDDFVDFVNDDFGAFAFYDIRQKVMYKNVHFENISDPTHDNWRTGQKRKYDLVWYPCCDEEPNHFGSCRVNNYDAPGNFPPEFDLPIPGIEGNRIDQQRYMTYEGVYMTYEGKFMIFSE